MALARRDVNRFHHGRLVAGGCRRRHFEETAIGRPVEADDFGEDVFVFDECSWVRAGGVGDDEFAVQETQGCGERAVGRGPAHDGALLPAEGRDVQYSASDAAASFRARMLVLSLDQLTTRMPSVCGSSCASPVAIRRRKIPRASA